MPELTDSYCERCGIRHVFSVSGSKGLSLKGARVLVKGLKNFVLNDGQSMSDSITTARLEYESGDSTRMTEAFHKAFNFCMTCRQYACDKCWNAQVGACLSCAPQADSAPVAPEGHLIVRTPVARLDPNWLNFSDPEGDKAAGSNTPSLPAGWPGPLPISPPPARPDQFSLQSLKPHQPTAAAQSAAWPAADLPGPMADSGPNGKSGRSGRTAADPGVWSLWPAADELAPEMTLTPEEMMLVEAELSHPESDEPAGTVYGAVDSTAGTMAETTPAPQATPEAKARVMPDPLPSSPSSSSSPSPSPSPSQMSPAPAVPVQPTPRVTTWHRPVGPAGILARLLGHRGATDTGGTPPRHEPTARGGVPTEPWPHPTPWVEAPLSARHGWADGADEPRDANPRADLAALAAAEHPAALAADLQADASNELVADQAAPTPLAEGIAEPEPVLTPVVAVEPAYKVANRPAPAASEPAVSDAAAAEPVAQIEDPARSQTDAEVADDARRTTASQPAPGRPAADAAPAPRPVAWPPFGASWPAPNPHRGTWPGPAAPLPAVLATQHAEPLFAAEMWAQSSQEVMNRGTVRVCHHCALPVSTQARFCRRCGTQQA